MSYKYDLQIKLAEEISSFPQECMNTDRLSAYYGMYSASSFAECIDRELKQGLKVLHKVAHTKVSKYRLTFM